MSIVAELLEAGVVSVDPDDESRVIFNVSLHIKKAAIEAGGFQAFGAEFGYEPILHDDEMNPVGPNPVSLYEFCKTQVRAYVTSVFRSAILKKANLEAKSQAEALLSQVL
jgi:hypothetical protein